ncbi:hypothetical protein Hanom_Chr09g00840851 [Helianthus anomalus]
MVVPYCSSRGSNFGDEHKWLFSAALLQPFGIYKDLVDGNSSYPFS